MISAVKSKQKFKTAILLYCYRILRAFFKHLCSITFGALDLLLEKSYLKIILTFKS